MYIIYYTIIVLYLVQCKLSVKRLKGLRDFSRYSEVVRLVFAVARFYYVIKYI